MKVAKDAFLFFIPVVIITVLLFFLNSFYGWIGVVLACYILFFFRDPCRKTPKGEGIIVSAADGKIVGIDQVIDNEFMDGKAWRVSIFLSIFNVHINYAPIAGKILYTKYTKGKFHSATSDKSSLSNENKIVGICDMQGTRVMVRIIAGLIARRIVSYREQGAQLTQGEKIGLIRFGSRVEVFMPLSTEIKVKVGDKVRGKSTVLGVIS